MKKIIMILLLSFEALSQKEMPTNEPLFPLPINNEGQVIYEGIVELPNLTKNDLYENARTWLAKAFRSSKSIIDYADKESGKIIMKVSASSYVKSLGMVYTMGYWSYTFRP